MSIQTIRRSFIVCSLALLSAVAAQMAPPVAPLRAEEPRGRQPSAADNEQPSKSIVPFVVERFKRNRYPGDEGKNHTMVKAAFRDVVADASQAVVQVFSGEKQVALGTVVASDGYILTKASELDGKIVCKLRDKSYDARIVRVHETTDLALLKIDAKNLTPVRWSHARPPAVGSFLATAGNTAQPLAIGVMSVAPRAIAAASGVLGIAVGESDVGARVDQVLDGTSAERAGMRPGDIIMRINGRAIKSRESLIDTVGEYRPGDRVRIQVRRGEDLLDFSTTLGNRKTGGRRDFQNRLGGDLSERRAGFPQAIQHDTVLRPRECGGPLVDLDGNVVGINIARAERVASYAIPASVVLDVIDDLLPRDVARESKAEDEGRTGRVTAARPVR